MRVVTSVLTAVLVLMLSMYFLRTLPVLLRRLFGAFDGRRRFRSSLLSPERRRNREMGRVRRDLNLRDVESAVFSLAYRLKGRITLSDIIIETGLGMREAEEVANGMVDGMRVRMEVLENGLVIYEFPEIIARFEEKSGA